jgi:uroporphyrinogen-III synthase
MRVLVTRPAEDAPRTAAALAARGHEAVLAPLFEVRALAGPFPAEADAVLAASANAVRCADAALLKPLLTRPFLAVGAATADAAREAGCTRVIVGEGDAAALARLAAAELPAGAHVLHLAGRPRRDEAIRALGGRLRITAVETYETVAAAALPAEAARALAAGGIDAVLHFSPRAAAVFADLAAAAGLLEAARRAAHVFISAAAAERRLPPGRVAERPSLESMLDAL